MIWFQRWTGSASASSRESQTNGVLLAILGFPLPEEGRLPVARGRADEGQPLTPSVPQPLQEALPPHEPFPDAGWLKLGCENRSLRWGDLRLVV